MLRATFDGSLKLFLEIWLVSEARSRRGKIPGRDALVNQKTCRAVFEKADEVLRSRKVDRVFCSDDSDEGGK